MRKPYAVLPVNAPEEEGRGMPENWRDRHTELLKLAKAAEERARAATDEDIRRMWLGVAQEWRALAEQARRISEL